MEFNSGQPERSRSSREKAAKFPPAIRECSRSTFAVFWGVHAVIREWPQTQHTRTRGARNRAAKTLESRQSTRSVGCNIESVGLVMADI